MKKWSSTFLLIISILLLSYTFYFYKSKSSFKLSDKRNQIVNFDNSLDSFTYQDKENTYNFYKNEDLSNWSVGNDKINRERADENVICTLFNNLSLLDLKYVFSVEELRKSNKDISDYGLDEPIATIDIHYIDRTENWLIGDSLSLGTLRYIMLKESKDIYVIDTQINDLLSLPIDEFYDYRVFTENIFQCDRIELSGSASDGFIQIVYSHESGWQLLQPRLLSINHSSVLDLFNQIKKIKLQSFNDVELSDSSVFGFDDPYMRLVISSIQNGSISLCIGDLSGDRKMRYVRRDKEDKIGLIDENIINDVIGYLEKLRKDQVFDLAKKTSFLQLSNPQNEILFTKGSNTLWRMNKPFDWGVDNEIFSQMLEFIEGMVITRFDVNANIDSKKFIVEINSKDSDNYQKISCFLPSDPDEPMQIKFPDEKEHHEVNRVRPLFNLLNPLSYKNKKIFSSIDRVTRVEQYIYDHDVNQFNWNSIESKWESKITDEHILILNWILKLRDIRADKYVSSFPTSLLPFGLENPIGRLILYDETHQKWNSLEIIIGDQYDDNFHYAMIKGRDIVFIISKESVSYCMENFK